MKECDIRLTFTPYILHPLLRGLFEWLLVQVRACLDDPEERMWSGLVAETELVLSGSHSDPDPLRAICPVGLEWQHSFRYRLVDHAVVEVDAHIDCMVGELQLDYLDRLEWIECFLAKMCKDQERLVRRSYMNMLQPPEPDWSILNRIEFSQWLRFQGDCRTVLSPEFGEPANSVEIEGVKYGEISYPLFETFSSDTDLTYRIFHKMQNYFREYSRSNNRRLPLVRHVYDQLFDSEAIQNTAMTESTDYNLPLTVFNIHEFDNLDRNLDMLDYIDQHNSNELALLRYLECELSSDITVLLRYLEADISYLSALAENPKPHIRIDQQRIAS